MGQTMEELEQNSHNLENPVLKQALTHIQKVAEPLAYVGFIRELLPGIGMSHGYHLHPIDEFYNAVGKFRTYNKWKDQAFARLAKEQSREVIVRPPR